METQDNPIPAEPADEPNTAPADGPANQDPAAEPATLSRDELARLIHSLADALAELADGISDRRVDPVHAAAVLATYARTAREQAGAQQ